MRPDRVEVNPMENLEAAKQAIGKIEGRTPLQSAAIAGNCDALLGLLASGANSEAVDVNGRTALHHAGEFNRP